MPSALRRILPFDSVDFAMTIYTAVQSQNALSAQLGSKQILL